METALKAVPGALNTTASMGPRFCKRGNHRRYWRASALVLASMGPRFCKRGNGIIASRRSGRVVASMGPRFCKRGNTSRRHALSSHVTASMGPRFCKRGNQMAVVSTGVTGRALQWGHAFVSVETIRLRCNLACLGELQWGHAFVSVETAPLNVGDHTTTSPARKQSGGATN